MQNQPDQSLNRHSVLWNRRGRGGLRFFVVCLFGLLAVLVLNDALGQQAPAVQSQPGDEVSADQAQVHASSASKPVDAAAAVEESAGDWVDWIQNKTYSIWHMELFKSGDTPIQLKQLVIALLVMLVGLYIAKRVAALIHQRLLKMKRLDQAVAFVIQKVAFYVMFCVSLFIALPLAGIPITIFALLGGALAIGVGFGAQTLCNNLISGLILMLERPVRIGDTVQVNDMTGQVEAIGTRSTQIRRGDGIHLLVPNSHFLESPVVNWTLHDSSVRAKVEVGVAYGSDTDLFAQLFLKAMRELPGVHETPEPEVLFTSFGDSALVFCGYFWVNAKVPQDLLRTESRVRFSVDAACRAHDIVIAFPQQDVHLDTTNPIQVQVNTNANSSADA